MEVLPDTPFMAFALPVRIVWKDEGRGSPRLHGVAFDLEEGSPFARQFYDIGRQSW